MKEYVALRTEEKQLIMNGKIMTLTFSDLYTLYIKIRTILFPHLLVNLFKEGCISSVKTYIKIRLKFGLKYVSINIYS